MTADSGSLVVKAANGTSWTWQYESATAVRKGGQKVSRSDLSAGEHVLVAGPVTSGNRDARVIIVAGPRQLTVPGPVLLGQHQFQLIRPERAFPAAEGAAGNAH